MTPSERNPKAYFATLERFKRRIAAAEAMGNTDRAKRLLLSLIRYKLMQNTRYGAIRRADPRIEDIR